MTAENRAMSTGRLEGANGRQFDAPPVSSPGLPVGQADKNKAMARDRDRVGTAVDWSCIRRVYRKRAFG